MSDGHNAVFALESAGKRKDADSGRARFRFIKMLGGNGCRHRLRALFLSFEMSKMGF